MIGKSHFPITPASRTGCPILRSNNLVPTAGGREGIGNRFFGSQPRVGVSNYRQGLWRPRALLSPTSDVRSCGSTILPHQVRDDGRKSTKPIGTGMCQRPEAVSDWEIAFSNHDPKSQYVSTSKACIIRMRQAMPTSGGAILGINYASQAYPNLKNNVRLVVTRSTTSSSSSPLSE